MTTSPAIAIVSIAAGIGLMIAVASMKEPTRSPVIPTTTMPAYCQDKASYRLPECGWTEEKQRKAEEANGVPASRAAVHQFWTNQSRELHGTCKKPVGKMSFDDIEYCSQQ